MKSDAELTQEYFEIANSLGGDLAGRRAASLYMKNSTAIVHHQVVASTFIPRLFNDKAWNTFDYVARMSHTILCKVITRYLEDESYRHLFAYDERLKQLILLPRGYDEILPLARIDLFLDEDTYDFGFCEINGDGSAGMNENREITNSIIESATYRQFSQRYDVEPCEIFNFWVDEFIRTYENYQHRIDNPRFAICDYLDVGVVDEFNIFAKYFQRRGYECVVCDVRDLTFNGTSLLDKTGKPIHAIWRRCVTNDVLEHWDESRELIEALKHEAVALIGSFAGHIVHDKQIFKVLFHPQTQEFLSEEERLFVNSHIPRTLFLTEKNVAEYDVLKNKDAWIVKPTDAYGAQDVYAGQSCTQDEWEALIGRFMARSETDLRSQHDEGTFILQTYLKPFKTITLPPQDDPLNTPDGKSLISGTAYNNLSGVYVFNGKFAGIFSRLGPLPIISKEHKGITAASFHVSEKG